MSGKVGFLIALSLFSVFPALHAQTRMIDSMLAVLQTDRAPGNENVRADTQTIRLLINITYELHKTDPDKGIVYGEHALSLARNLSWKSGIAWAQNYTGLCYWSKADYPKALQYYYTALSLAESIPDHEVSATIYGNIGLVYADQGDYPKALELHLKALNMNEKRGDQKKIALNLGNIGIVYDAQGQYQAALKHYFRAIKIYRELKDKNGLARNLSNIAFVYQEMSQHAHSLEYNFQALRLNRETGNKMQVAMNLGNLGETYYNIANDSTFRKSNVWPDSLPKERAVQRSRLYLTQSIGMYEQVGNYYNLSELYLYLSNLEALAGHYRESLQAYKLYTASQDSVFNEENTRKSMHSQMQYEFEKLQAVAKAEQEKKDAVTAAQIKLNRLVRDVTIAGMALLILFMLVLIRQRNKVKKEKLLVERAKLRSDQLLLNILPAETAEELKNTGFAKAKDFEATTIMFTDFKNFTAISEELNAQELVNEINFCYTAFDRIITSYNIEKIKTIGDSYMCAGGLSEPATSKAEDVVRAALEIRDFMLAEQQKRQASGRSFFEIRIGINTGPVVAGIVGIKKFSYDIWGDAVNVASRMESSGEAGKVNISGQTYALVQDVFTCTYRGKVEAKHKGVVDMYFVEGPAA